MAAQTPGKIFLADQRGLVETSYHRRYCTFSFGDYAHAHKGPFGRLHGFNEETLAGTQTLALPIGQATYVLLIPITGDLAYRTATLPMATLQVGEMQLLTLPSGDALHLANPYETELISFLHLWVHAAEPTLPIATQRFTFNLAAAPNQLIEVLPPLANQGLPFGVRIGQFAGRREANYHVQPGADFFAFVLAGAFEVEGRLLHEHDGLALWQVADVELEALSNYATILVLELN
ncbi:hypothetical protein GO988_03205 [Hymenobacter sp. HMF4947]|uniref:Quercetin 2,3-dioxygenase C-terminal cupin domain-containing protein n=1 Tax=Hymenobacter ginkgonis TaxID=2682976 RepID=A0A7K1TAA5_9BACT|nr:hypothetical protein [Hymenobacter ginkgonis]MVN75325.1 hypothetical protein [Hymenobacter ginkgonis]